MYKRILTVCHHQGVVMLMLDCELLQLGLGLSSHCAKPCLDQNVPPWLCSSLHVISPHKSYIIWFAWSCTKKPNGKSPRGLGHPPSAIQYHAESKGDVKSCVSSKLLLGPIISCLSERLICLGRLSWSGYKVSRSRDSSVLVQGVARLGTSEIALQCKYGM